MSAGELAQTTTPASNAMHSLLQRKLLKFLQAASAVLQSVIPSLQPTRLQIPGISEIDVSDKKSDGFVINPFAVQSALTSLIQGRKSHGNQFTVSEAAYSASSAMEQIFSSTCYKSPFVIKFGNISLGGT